MKRLDSSRDGTFLVQRHTAQVAALVEGHQRAVYFSYLNKAKSVNVFLTGAQVAQGGP
jgi:hypothetical protein